MVQEEWSMEVYVRGVEKCEDVRGVEKCEEKRGEEWSGAEWCVCVYV